MGRGLAARGQRQVPADQRVQITVDTSKPAQVQNVATVTTPGQRITSITLDDGTKIVEKDLGGVVTASRYPLNSTARITITP